MTNGIKYLISGIIVGGVSGFMLGGSYYLDSCYDKYNFRRNSERIVELSSLIHVSELLEEKEYEDARIYIKELAGITYEDLDKRVNSQENRKKLDTIKSKIDSL